jgi:hypothetical protein
MVVLPVMGKNEFVRNSPSIPLLRREGSVTETGHVYTRLRRARAGGRGWFGCDAAKHHHQLFSVIASLGNYLFAFFFILYFPPAVLSQQKPVSISRPDTAKADSVQILFFPHAANSQQNPVSISRRDTGEADTVQTVYDYIEQNVSNLASPKYVEQRQKRNAFHRKTYADVLFDESNNDGLTALFGYIKLELHINYSLESLYRTFYYHGWPIPDYYGFPVDPWKKEWWSSR